MIDGIEINQVTIVGLVRAVKENATRLDYEVDDMTGPPLEVKQFVDNDVSFKTSLLFSCYLEPAEEPGGDQLKSQLSATPLTL